MATVVDLQVLRHKILVTQPPVYFFFVTLVVVFHGCGCLQALGCASRLQPWKRQPPKEEKEAVYVTHLRDRAQVPVLAGLEAVPQDLGLGASWPNYNYN